MKLLISTLLVGLSFLWGAQASPEKCPLVDINEFNSLAKQPVKIITPKKANLGKNEIRFEVQNDKLPSGYMLVAYADIHAFSANTPPKVIDGYPITTITLHEPGEYEFELKLNLVYKGS